MVSNIDNFYYTQFLFFNFVFLLKSSKPTGFELFHLLLKYDDFFMTRLLNY